MIFSKSKFIFLLFFAFMLKSAESPFVNFFEKHKTVLDLVAIFSGFSYWTYCKGKQKRFNQEVIQSSAYNRGKSAGHQAGYKNGFQDGYVKGYKLGNILFAKFLESNFQAPYQRIIDDIHAKDDCENIVMPQLVFDVFSSSVRGISLPRLACLDMGDGETYTGVLSDTYTSFSSFIEELNKQPNKVDLY